VNLLSKSHPEDLILSHGRFIIDNIKGILSVSSWKELYGFKADSVIYVKPKPARPKMKGDNSVNVRAASKIESYFSQNAISGKKIKRNSSIPTASKPFLGDEEVMLADEGSRISSGIFGKVA
jgi:hypothetical protein